MSQESLYQDRLAKREKVRALGIDPYGKNTQAHRALPTFDCDTA